MQNPVIFLGGEDGPIDMLAHLKRCPQYERARSAGLAVERREFGTRELGVVLMSDRNALSPQVASIEASDPDRNCQLGAGIDLARRDLDRARALTVRPNCLCGHGVN